MNIYHISRLLPNSDLRQEDEEIIQNIVRKIEKNEDLDIRLIATTNFTSPSSISRLAKRAGFNNFKEMIFFLKQKFTESQSGKRELLAQPFIITNHQWEEIDLVFEMIKRQKHVYLSGAGFCDFLVKYSYRKLMLKKIYAIDLTDLEIKLIAEGEPKNLMIFSQSGENKNGIRKIRECQSLGGKVITFTATAGSSFAREGDVSFLIDPESEGINNENSTLNFFFGNSINALEYLFNRYF
ncbi:MurR/RpiR family transcriptional regulator [Enterococcus sp.]|uniref:MurR/RpiR family transcriptional regulator n=1 Tax=Enterococcus sp. TaxID=35783 RepID=UPI002FCA72D1